MAVEEERDLTRPAVLPCPHGVEGRPRRERAVRLYEIHQTQLGKKQRAIPAAERGKAEDRERA